jgi:hypothetical protein
MRVLLVLTVAVAMFVAVACGGGSASVVPAIVDARAERDVGADGAAHLSSTITVHFASDVHAAGGNVPFASHFELAVPGPSGLAERVLLQTAKLDGKTVTLTVDRVLPQGTTLKIARSAFPGSAGDLQVDVASNFTPAAVILATKALQPTDPDVVPANPVSAPVKPEDRDPAVQRQALKTLLQQHNAPAEVVDTALSRYDQMSVDIVPSPKMRAALAALTGTFAEPATTSLLTGDNCTGKPASLIAFQPPPDAPQLMARVTYAIGGQRILSIDPALESDRIEHIMPLLAHEAIHCDRQDSRSEEVAAVAFETFLYLQLIAADPTVVHTGTLAAREMNINSIAFINSGRRYPESVGILPSPGVSRVLPGSDSKFGSFGELVAAAYPDVAAGSSPDEATAVAYVARLAKIVNMAPQSPFNIKYLDELLGLAMDANTLQQAIAALTAVPAD